MGLEGDFEALVSHGIGASLEDFLIKGVEHMDAEVEPVSAEVMARGESAEAGFFFKKGDACPEFEGGVSGVKSTGSATEDSEMWVFGHQAKSSGERAWS